MKRLKNLLFYNRIKYIGGSLCVGYCAQQYLNYSKQQQQLPREKILPNGFPQSCCSFDDHSQSSSLHSSELNSILQSTLYIPLSECENHHHQFDNLLIQKLCQISGKENVLLSNETNTTSYTKGVRIGQGKADIIFRPGTLKEAVDGLRACVASDVVIIPQGRNTGLTGGSVPRSISSRPTVVFNMTRLTKVQQLDNQMLCFAGAGIHDLSILTSKIGRESHSILGSVFLNPTVGAGLAFGSGGTQMRKGPAYTERALWCSIDDKGEVIVHNTLGIGSTRITNIPINEDEILTLLDNNIDCITNIDKDIPASCAKKYSEQLCEINSDLSRYNADTHGIDPCRSEGKVLILASIHDTFPIPKYKKSYWISCKTLEDAYYIRNQILLENPKDLPISCEYMNHDCYHVIDTCGRLLCYCLSMIGINQKLYQLWSFKLFLENFSFLKTLPDKILYFLNPLVPVYLPPHLHSLHKNYSHHLLLTLGDYDEENEEEVAEEEKGVAKKEKRKKLSTIEKIEMKLFELQSQRKQSIGEVGEIERIKIHELTEVEDIQKVNNFRFVAAIAFKVWCIGHGLNGISIDYTQRKDDTTEPNIIPTLSPSMILPTPPSSIASSSSLSRLPQEIIPLLRMRYSHFGCNVIHEDIGFDILSPSSRSTPHDSGSDENTNMIQNSPSLLIENYKKEIKKIIEMQGGKLPAEHGHGIEYIAPKSTQERWMKMDPLNMMNPGIGGLSNEKWYGRNQK